MDKMLEELTAIRKELENIRLILEYKYVPQYAVKRKRIDGKIVRIRHTLQAPLEELRTTLHTNQQHRKR